MIPDVLMESPESIAWREARAHKAGPTPGEAVALLRAERPLPGDRLLAWYLELTKRSVLKMSHAELDVLEMLVSALRKSGNLPSHRTGRGL